MAQLAFPAFLRERIITFELRSCINSLLNDANDVLLEKLSHEDFFNRWFIKLPTSGDPYGDTKEAERSVQLMLDRITKMVA